MGARLTTSRYTVPGVYIGQLIRPGPGNLSSDARVCDYIGQGSRLAQVKNSAIRRSFVFDEDLIFPPSAPFEASLDFPADGSKSLPARIFNDVTGVELREDQWEFLKVGSDFLKVVILPSAFSPTAIYRIDYQSTSRSVLDPLPIDDIRLIKSLGTTQDQAEFEDFINYFIPFTFAGPTADTSNAIAASFLTSIFPDAGNTGAGTTAIDASASFNHNYNRFYQLEVTAIAGVSGTFTADFEWSAARYSGGVDALPATPIHTTGTKPTFIADEASAPTLIQELEVGIKVAITFAGTNFAIGDKFYFNGVGPGLIEFDGRLANTNQFTEFSSIDPVGAIAGTGSLVYSATNTYTGTYNTNFDIEVTASAGGIGSRTVTFIWGQYGEVIGASSTLIVDETITNTFSLTQGVELTVDFGGANFTVGDKFTFSILAPKIYYQAKDDRVYDLTISAATNPGADTGFVSGSYSTGTAEGGFGSWEANVNLLLGISQATGFFSLPDGVKFAVRNAMRGNINGTSFVTGDGFDASVTSNDFFDWSLTTRVQETREVTAFNTDVTGAVTGTAGTTYVILSDVYQPGSVAIEDEDTSAPISFIELPGTQFVAFVTTPTDSVLINYEFRGNEPSPGQLYYLTANYLRPTNLYNVPTLVLDRDDGRAFLGPSEVDNHLFIMNELVFDNGAPGAYYTQPFDQDGDGVLSTTDITEALSAHEKVSRPSDLCLLSQFESLGPAMAVNVRGNDPFERREQMLWVGTPIGTPIGDVETPETLVFLARRTLQVPPQSPAQGTRVLLAPTECSKLIVLESGVEQLITLDGSFVAGATSALVNSFADPSVTVLRQNVTGFETLQTYTDPENLILGGASILWMSDQGNSVFRYEEDITVHTLSEEFQLISGTVQKQFVVRVVRREMEDSLIALVVPSAEAGVAAVRSVLGEILTGLLGRGLIADYQDADGNIREFDIDSDVVVIRDSTSLTKYDFFFSFFIFSPIKRLFGLFSVNTNDFGLSNI